MAASKLKVDQWQFHLEAWQTSKLSKNRYCQERGLSVHTFNYWSKKLTRSDRQDVVSSSNRLVPVAVSSSETQRAIQIVLPNGIQINMGMGEGKLTDLLRSLKELT